MNAFDRKESGKAKIGQYDEYDRQQTKVKQVFLHSRVSANKLKEIIMCHLNNLIKLASKTGLFFFEVYHIVVILKITGNDSGGQER